MYKYSFLLVSLFFSASTFSQQFKNDSVKVFVDRSIDLIKSNAVDISNVDLIRKGLYNKAQNLDRVSEAAPLYAEVFELLGDYHGSLKYKGRSYGWNKDLATNNVYLKGKLKAQKSVVSKVIDKNIGYIRIPGNNDFAFKKVDSIANDITDHINNINSGKIKAWIIDLRVNTGGNMYPILLGLKEFIGTESTIFGGFRNSKGESSGKWEIKDGKMLIDGNELVRKVGLNNTIKKDTPIVILTSCYTASAGEMTAIALIGRKNTFVVGEPTADYTTAVQGFSINADAGLNLSTDYVVDRNLKIYKSNIKPDFEILGGDHLEDLKKDKKIMKALEILRHKS
ncbi:S41 family peptidase [Elizabethkingia meningoseptica]|uniref:S41 family peptidase n=1 Tax=Elizabethkingia meningoseptica TaxID=238 RepID=UPI0023AF567E|nr:S41 family peptidase [Elizabethkingia meningoseptica]MDE5518203.1 S41 family peptidase [Elizabethkingia meningoseptica]